MSTVRGDGTAGPDLTLVVEEGKPDRYEKAEWWVENGYLMGKQINAEADIWICLAPMIFTWRVMLCSPTFVYGFACYDKETKFDLAVRAFNEWDGQGLPLEGYERTVGLGGSGEKNK